MNLLCFAFLFTVSLASVQSKKNSAKGKIELGKITLKKIEHDAAKINKAMEVLVNHKAESNNPAFWKAEKMVIQAISTLKVKDLDEKKLTLFAPQAISDLLIRAPAASLKEADGIYNLQLKGDHLKLILKLFSRPNRDDNPVKNPLKNQVDAILAFNSELKDLSNYTAKEAELITKLSVAWTKLKQADNGSLKGAISEIHKFIDSMQGFRNYSYLGVLVDYCRNIPRLKDLKAHLAKFDGFSFHQSLDEFLRQRRGKYRMECEKAIEEREMALLAKPLGWQSGLTGDKSFHEIFYLRRKVTVNQFNQLRSLFYDFISRYEANSHGQSSAWIHNLKDACHALDASTKKVKSEFLKEVMEIIRTMEKGTKQTIGEQLTELFSMHGLEPSKDHNLGEENKAE